MGQAVIKAADSAGLNVVPVSFGSLEESGQTIQASGKDILVHGPLDRENVLASVFDEYPNLIVVDYTVPSAVNGNLMTMLRCNNLFTISIEKVDSLLTYYKLKIYDLVHHF